MTRVDAVGEQVHRALLGAQRAGDGGTQVGIVLDEQYAHVAGYLRRLNRN